MLAAVTVLAISLVKIPAFSGRLYFHLGETVILTSALLLGKRGGALVGAVGSAVADLLLGAPVLAPISFVIHGVEGYLVGYASQGKVPNIMIIRIIREETRSC
nr:ECF transporter S component [Zhaonella formicivorans]